MDWVEVRVHKMNTNSRIIFQNTVVAFAVKGISLSLSLATTPAFIRYFGNNTILGVWYTLLSVLTWVLNFDLGIGNGIRNSLVRDFANNDLLSARKTLSSGLCMNAFLTIVLTVLGTVFINFLDLNWIFNVDNTAISYNVLLKSALTVFWGIMLRFYLSCISSVFYALQISALNNFLGLCVSILQFLFVLLYKPENSEQGLLVLSGAYAIVSNLPIFAAGVIVFATKLRACRPSLRYIDKQYVHRVMGLGTVFFVCQITYMLLMNTNEFYISRFFGPSYTTEYTFYYKITSLTWMVLSMVLAPMWSAITKAMAENQYDWVARLYKKLKCIGYLTIILQFAFVPVEQLLMDIWLGKGTLQVDYFTAIAFACFGSVFIYTALLSTMVCGMARMKIQMISYCIGVLGKFVFIFTLAPIVGHWSVVVWSNVLALLPYCIIQQIDLDRYFKQW